MALWYRVSRVCRVSLPMAGINAQLGGKVGDELSGEVTQFASIS